MNRLDSAAPARIAPRSSVADMVTLAARLAPRQLNDELSLAGIELKRKGAQVGVAAGLLGGALVLLAFMVISLLVAAIMGLGVVVEPWLAALIFAAVFLVLGAILGLIGGLRAKKTMPLMPEEAWRGIRWDLGVLSEGHSFDPATLDAKPAKQEKAEPAQPEAPKEPGPSHAELLARTAERREHLAQLRDSLDRKLDVKQQTDKIRVEAKRAADSAQQAAVSGFTRIADQGSATVSTVAPVLQERWKPLAVLGASLTAVAVLVGRLLKK
ncbi:phage holin family protein [Arthrobacter sp. I2-34]|uniref:Phage holin family protein n=1 Tax=Arthrobacter hankyongi TaxID=2904801 RepID=A0ABS9L1P2_9MICC|nr:phage holin family protein [Arthrobacter hankyongi]MCG2620422.1 phage holin family protein [Arthrobacter hankyongi]